MVQNFDKQYIYCSPSFVLYFTASGKENEQGVEFVAGAGGGLEQVSGPEGEVSQPTSTS